MIRRYSSIPDKSAHYGMYVIVRKGKTPGITKNVVYARSSQRTRAYTG